MILGDDIVNLKKDVRELISDQKRVAKGNK
jgi:hypothetical protein